MKIITFCGHKDFFKDYELYKNKIISIIEEITDKKSAIFYLGGYGGFDLLAYSACKEYKKKYSESKLIFVTPYLDEKYLNDRNIKEDYDEILFPDLEKTPKRFAILKRNEFMVLHSDYLIAHIEHSWGGAYKSLQHAIKQKIPFINLGSYNHNE